MLLLFLYFASLGFCRSATFDNAGPQAIKELIDSDFNSFEPVQIVDETLLVRVLVQNGTSALGCVSSGCGANDAKLPDLDRRQYVEIDEDTKCGLDHNFVQLGVQLLYNSWGSHSDGPARRITCRVYSPENMRDTETTEPLTIMCQNGGVCRQDGVRQTRFGDEKPSTDCVLSSTITSWVIKTRELGEKCSAKFRYSSAGAAGTSVKFHIWAWDMSTGLFVQLKWIYLKINSAYVKSAFDISDWTISYTGIKSTDIIETCGTGWGNDPDLEV
jgi:hypothetical protein